MFLSSIFNALKLFIPKLAYYAVTHVTAARNAIADAVLTEIGNNGQMTLRTVGDVALATLTLPTTSGTVGATDLTFGTFTSETNASAGTVDHIRIETSVGGEVFRFLPADITISSTTLGAGDTVSCSSLIYQPPA